MPRSGSASVNGSMACLLRLASYKALALPEESVSGTDRPPETAAVLLSSTQPSISSAELGRPQLHHGRGRGGNTGFLVPDNSGSGVPPDRRVRKARPSAFRAGTAVDSVTEARTLAAIVGPGNI